MTDRRTARRERRHHSFDFKMAVVAEAMTPGASVAEVARRHGLNANMVFIWRKDQRFNARRLPGPALLPVEITPDLLMSAASVAEDDRKHADLRAVEPSSIEITLLCGIRLTCCGSIDASALADVLRVLKTA